jgi:hypothetical protein
LRALVLLTASIAAAALLAGCGGGGGTTTTATTGTVPFDPASNVTYERSYSDCGSVALTDLANRYHAKRNKTAVSVAVGLYWAKQAGGGAAAAEAGREGCLDGFKAAGG